MVLYICSRNGYMYIYNFKSHKLLFSACWFKEQLLIFANILLNIILQRRRFNLSLYIFIQRYIGGRGESNIIIRQKQPPETFYKKEVLRDFPMFTGQHVCWSLFLIKLQAWNFIKKRLQHRCFPVNTAKFLRAPILKNIC